jgi:uncharacterized protein (DUF433 family)
MLAFTTDQVHRLTGLSQRQIRYWATRGFFSPSYADQERRPFGRIYSFQDLVWLRTIALLMREHGIKQRQLQPVAEWLRSHPRESWSTLRFYVAGKQIALGDSELNAILSASDPEQTVIPICMDEITRSAAADAAALGERAPDEIGGIVQNRYVSHNYPTLAGTRIRTEAIWNFHEAGHSHQDILRQYPRLQPADIEAAIAFERERRFAG